jgi:hypothetical protein
MNTWEREYGARLGVLRSAREIQWYTALDPRGRVLRLAYNTTYTPDFLVIANDGRAEFHEVKGFMRDDAAVKIKVAAEMFPEAAFYLCKKVRGSWKVTRVGGGENAK